jgi:hypothetical protein
MASSSTSAVLGESFNISSSSVLPLVVASEAAHDFSCSPRLEDLSAASGAADGVGNSSITIVVTADFFFGGFPAKEEEDDVRELRDPLRSLFANTRVVLRGSLLVLDLLVESEKSTTGVGGGGGGGIRLPPLPGLPSLAPSPRGALGLLMFEAADSAAAYLASCAALRLGQSLKSHRDMRGTEVDLERGMGLDLWADLEQSVREAAPAFDGPVGQALTCRGVAAVVDPPAGDEVVDVGAASGRR